LPDEVSPSLSSLDAVRTAYAAWNRDDLEAAIPVIDREVEWRASGEFPGMAAVYRGHEGVRQFWEDLKAPWEYFTIHVRDISGDEERVVALLRFEAVGRGSGVKVNLDFVNVFEVREGRIVRFTSRRTLEEALRAADQRS
jgi:ketosteroid isomerase-like protein